MRIEAAGRAVFIYSQFVADQKKGDSIATGLGCLFLIGLGIWAMSQGLGKIWGEQEGYVKTDDCRSTVMLKASSPETWFKKFTCVYRRTKRGVLISGVCVSVDTDGAVCKTVYEYEREGPKVCTDPKFPYLREDDMCYEGPQ